MLLLPLLTEVEPLLAVDQGYRDILFLIVGVEVDQVNDVLEWHSHVGCDDYGWGILLRRVDLCRRDDGRHRVDRGGLYAGGARPVPRAPFGSPRKAWVEAFMNLATVMIAATLGA